ncbi:MAG: tetratricopeptide repeat protein [Pyrinomonadaceae bacterium]
MNCFKLIQIGLFIVILSFGATAQTPETAKTQGIELYQKGDYQGAISLFQTLVKTNKKDGEAFYFLGASQLRADDLKTARKSLSKAANLLPQDVRPISGLAFVALRRGKMSEARKYAAKAVALNPNDSESQYLLGEIEKLDGKYATAIAAAGKAIALDPNFAPAYLLKAEASIYNSVKFTDLPDPVEQKSHFTNAILILQSYPNLSASTPDANGVRDMIDGYTAFADYYDRVEKRKNAPDPLTDENPAANNPNEKRLQILSKPRANYTEDARKNLVSGTIRILVLFSKTGKITAIPITGLPYGLTGQALQAARQIKFVPMQKDGQPVSTVRVIEYNFNIY